MLEGGEFLLHLAHLHVAGGAARFVKEIDDPSRQTAEEDDEKPGHPDESRRRRPVIRRGARRNSAQIGQHDLKDVFARAHAGETDRER